MEKNEKNKKLAILVGTLIVVIGVSFAYLTGVTDTRGNGEIAEGNITVIKGAELNVQGFLEFNDTGILPGHKNVSSIKVTATGNNDLIPYNLIWNGTNALNTPLNFTVYKTSENIEVTSTCNKKNKIENGLSYLSEECMISNLDKLGDKVAIGTIETSNTETKVILAQEEFITATSTGTIMYYYIILEYPNLNENQNIDIGKTFDGVICVEESNSKADINVLAIHVKQEGGEYKQQTDFPENITDDGTGYILNTEKSVCNNEAIPSWDYKNKALVTKNLTKSGTSCYLYFTTNPIITSIEPIETTSHSIKVKINVSSPSIVKYYYSINDGEFIEKKESEYIFSDLDVTTEYKIKVKILDIFGNSTIKEIKLRTTGASEIILATMALKEGSPDFNKVATINEGVYKTIDDNGKESYYYRGAVTNNYLKFAGFWWRIIRINGDGTIRIIYDGTEYHANGSVTVNSIIVQNQSYNLNWGSVASVGFMYGNDNGNTYEETHSNINKSEALIQLESWFKNNLEEYSNYISINAGFCGDRTRSSSSSEINNENGIGAINNAYTYFGAYIRLTTNKIPILTCQQNNDLYTVKGATRGNKSLDYPIGLITADEVYMAGGMENTYNKSYYLYNGQKYWTMTPHWRPTSSSSRVFTIYTDGQLTTYYYADRFSSVDDPSGIRPVINLRADVQITGSGTSKDPFVVVGAE